MINKTISFCGMLLVCINVCVYIYHTWSDSSYHLSGCRNPDDLCSILSSLSPSLSRTFRDVAFFFRGIHVSEMHSRELSRKILKRIPCVPWQTHTETLVPRLPCESL